MDWESTISPSVEEPGRDGRGPDADDESDTPALFVTSMPRDLWANPSLGALAALIDEDNEEHQDRGCQDEGEDGPDEGVGDDDKGKKGNTWDDDDGDNNNMADDQGDDDTDRDDRDDHQRLRQTVRQEDRDGGDGNHARSDRLCPGSMRSVGNSNRGGGASSHQSMPDAVTAAAFPGNNLVVSRRRRRDDVQLKRNERRASPYSTSLASRATARQEANAKANAKSARGSTDGETYGGRSGKKAGPTAGETQVLMSLWAL